MKSQRPIVVAGHICLDVIPQFPDQAQNTLEQVLTPGKLIDIGPATTATGGAVANVGLALHRLGSPTRLIGKVGDDAFGHTIKRVLGEHDPALANHLLISPDDQTSYTIVISPPGVDRIFLHHPGANDTFCAGDVPDPCFADASLFHFGYPPLMRSIYQDGGVQLAELFSRAKAHGLITSLDMALPDPQSDAGRIDWCTWLKCVLPHVDVFMPSHDEILFMLGLGAGALDAQAIAEVADQLIQWGTAAVMIKLGDQGVYLKTSIAPSRMQTANLAEDWCGRIMYCPCQRAEVVGTTGSGDCTIAGFLHGISLGIPVEQCVQAAVAVGASSVEAVDANSGIRPWSNIQKRMDAGWPHHAPHAAFGSWAEAPCPGVRCAPDDSAQRS